MTKFTKLLDFHKSDQLHNQPSECKLRENTDLSELEDSTQQMQLIMSTLIRNLSHTRMDKQALASLTLTFVHHPVDKWVKIGIRSLHYNTCVVAIT